MEEGFLGRWSRRKLAKEDSVSKKESIDDSPSIAESTIQEPGINSGSTLKVGAGSLTSETRVVVDSTVGQSNSNSAELNSLPVDEPPVDLPTEADLQLIQSTGNVSAFLKESVTQELKNKAFRELFKIPSFNHVDMLDIYMEDYNKFTPLTPEVRDRMSGIKELLEGPEEKEDIVERHDTISIEHDPVTENVGGPLEQSKASADETAPQDKPVGQANISENESVADSDLTSNTSQPKENP